MENASKHVYGTCKLSHLSTIILILNLQTVHGWTNASVDELLALLHRLLPPDSTLPKNQSACKEQMKKVGVDAWKFAGGNSKGFSPINVPN